MVWRISGRWGLEGSSTTTRALQSSTSGTPSNAVRTSNANVPIPHARGGYVEKIAVRMTAARLLSLAHAPRCPMCRRPKRQLDRLGATLPGPLGWPPESSYGRGGRQLAALRVAVLAPVSWRVPPRHYGPWAQVASLLTEGLVERGVDVTLFASADYKTAARLASVVPRGYSEDPGANPKVSECLHIAHAFERAEEFDLIHNSFDFLPLTYSELVETPVLTTIHGFSSPRILAVYQRYNASSAYVAISDSDRDPSLDYLATIHHGIDTDAFTLHATPGGYLLFFGRIHPDKGTVEAIDVAARCGLPLVIAGIVHAQQYFDELVAPRIDGSDVSFIGAVGPDERSELLGGAQALVHLISFAIPFAFSVVPA